MGGEGEHRLIMMMKSSATPPKGFTASAKMLVVQSSLSDQCWEEQPSFIAYVSLIADVMLGTEINVTEGRHGRENTVIITITRITEKSAHRSQWLVKIHNDI